MALSGLEIYKLLPKTNCKKCGFQTCLAFAMQLAKKAVPVDKCPFVTSEIRAVLEEAQQPAIRLVELGAGDHKTQLGQETVLFRHEEKFYHPTAIGIIIEDDLDPKGLSETLEEINRLTFERVGQNIGVDLVAIRNRSKSKEKFLQCLREVKIKTKLNFVLMVDSAEILKDVLGLIAESKPLVYCQEAACLESFVALCKEYKVALAVKGGSIDELSGLTKKIAAQGFNDIVLGIGDFCANARLWQLTQIRRLAIKKAERSLGFPTMVVVEEGDPEKALVEASIYVAKYASVVLLKTRRPEDILPLLTLRQNIFTDPQKPLQVEPKVYPVGNATGNSPVLITTNFSLTYYTVLGEIESSRIPAYLICMDTEGMSVLTAWAAEKFGPEKITDTLSRFKLQELVKHRNLIIPGYVAMMSGDLEEKSGWHVIVGPREAAGLSSFLKNLKS